MLRTHDERLIAKRLCKDADFKEEMAELLYTKMHLCSDSTIPTWMADINKDKRIPESVDWINFIRKNKYDEFQSADSLSADA